MPILTMSPTGPVWSPRKCGLEEEMNGFTEVTDLDIGIKTAAVTSTVFTNEMKSVMTLEGMASSVPQPILSWGRAYELLRRPHIEDLPGP